MTAAVCFGIFFNNVLRWYPFPAGRSVNDLSTLEDNLFGIAVNALTYGTILLLAMMDGRSLDFSLSSLPLVLYCGYVSVQTVFRPDPALELARSLALIAAILSADRLAALLARDLDFLSRFLRGMWMALVASLFVGLLIGLVKPDSVNWGAGRSPSFIQEFRADFFFFHILPYPTVAICMIVLSQRRRWSRIERVVALLSLIAVFWLGLLTMTRSIVFPCLLVVLVFLFRRSRTTTVGLIAVALSLVLLFPEQAKDVAIRLRIYAEHENLDLTTHRAGLLALDLELFAESPLFGLGAQEARRRIVASPTIAKTEHGYTIHLASYGLVSGLFLGWVLMSLAVSVRMIWVRRPPPGLPADLAPVLMAIAGAAVATTGLGFVWVLGSATAFYDWMSFFILSLANAIWAVGRRNAAGLPFPESARAGRHPLPHRLDSVDAPPQRE